LKADPDKIRVTKTPIKTVEVSEPLTLIAESESKIDLVPPVAMKRTEEKAIEVSEQKVTTSETKSVIAKTTKPKRTSKDFDRGRMMPPKKRQLSEGKKVIVAPNSHTVGFQIVGSEFVDVQKFKLGDKKAFLKFIYNSVIVEVRLIKVDGIWYYKSTSTDHQQQDYIVREELLQIALNHERMQDIIERNKVGEFKPLTLLSNGFFSNMIEVTFGNKNLKIVPNKYNRNFDRKMPYADFTKFQIKRRKATIQFAYRGHLVEANFRKKNGAWIFKSFIHKNGETTYKDVNF